MAKAKKTDSAGTKKAGKASPASDGSTPTIDTETAAKSAAKQLVAKLPSTTGNVAAATESTGFKSLKDSLNRPASSTMANLLDKSAPVEKQRGGTPFPGGKQVGRNQTFGADVNRSSVPRRTGGG